MNEKLTPEEITQWKQATAICNQLAGLPFHEAKLKLSELGLTAEIKNLVIKILEKQSFNTQILEDSSGQNLLSTLEQNTEKPGSEIGGYKLKELIAKGGMSTVYLAEHSDSGTKKDVAIKLLSPYCTTDKSIELFLREQQILSKLYHPNIVSFHHSGQTSDGTHYLVMEYIEGGQKITDYCQDKKYNNRAIVDLIIQLCDIFAYTHNEQIIHRDIKPSNILIDHTGQPKVIDFGIGRFETLNDKTSTHVFTLEAASPEQILGLKITSQTDVFSLGALLLELLTKQAPLPKTNIQNYDPQDDINHIKRLIQSANIDKDLSNVIKKAMHMDLNRRYLSMKDFKMDLVNWQNHLPVTAAGDTAFYRIKKFYQRNQVLSVSLLIVMATAFSSLFYIHVSNQEKQLFNEQRANSLALVEAMFKQMDPMKNEGRGKNEALIDFFQNPSQEMLNVIQSDPEIEFFYYEKLARLYQNITEFNLALLATQSAKNALLKYREKSDEMYLELELMTLHLMEALGQHQLVFDQAPEILSLINQFAPNNMNLRLDYLHLLNKLHSNLSQFKEAFEVTQQIEAFIAENKLLESVAVDKKLLGKMYNSMAVVWRQNGFIDKAERDYLMAISLLKNLPDSKHMMGTIYNNLAILKGRSGQYDQSENYFQEAIEIYQSIDEDNLQLGSTYVTYATLKRFAGEPDAAKEALLKAINIYEKFNDEVRLGEAYYRLMGLSMSQNEVMPALEYANLSFKYFLSEKQPLNPKMADPVAFAFWFLLFDEFKDQAAEFALTFDHFISQNSQMNAAQMFQFQKQLLANDQADTTGLSPIQATFIQFLKESKNMSNEQSIKWLTAALESYNGDKNILYYWLQTDLASRQNNQTSMSEYCRSNQEWMDSSWLFFKHSILKKCLSDLQPENSTELATLQATFDQINLALINHRAEISEYLSGIITAARNRFHFSDPPMN